MTDDTQSAPQAVAAATSPKTQEPTVTRNRTHIAAVSIVSAFAAGAIVISFTHQIELAHHYGVAGWQAWTAPFFIDGFMLLGRLGQSLKFDAATNRIGRRFMAVAALLSLAANILVGATLGQRVFGALVVAGFISAEWYAGKLKPAPAAAPQPTADELAAADLAAKRSAAAKKAAETRKANAAKAAKKPRTRKPAAPKVPASAPVSPAPGGRMVGGLWLPEGAAV